MDKKDCKKDITAMSIADAFHSNTRVRNAIWNALYNIAPDLSSRQLTVGNLLEISESELVRSKGIGAHSLGVIKEFLKSHSLELKPLSVRQGILAEEKRVKDLATPIGHLPFVDHPHISDKTSLLLVRLGFKCVSDLCKYNDDEIFMLLLRGQEHVAATEALEAYIQLEALKSSLAKRGVAFSKSIFNYESRFREKRIGKYFLDCPVQELNLSIGSHLLLKNGIKTVRDLTMSTAESIMNDSEITKESIEEIRGLLQAHGLDFLP